MAAKPRKKKADFSNPMEVDDVELSLGVKALEIMPAWSAIPAEFKTENKFTPLFNAIAFRGAEIKSVGFVKAHVGRTDELVTYRKAMRHLNCIVRSWEPEHEHKEAAFCYLCSLWFKDIKFEPKPAAK